MMCFLMLLVWMTKEGRYDMGGLSASVSGLSTGDSLAALLTVYFQGDIFCLELLFTSVLRGP